MGAMRPVWRMGQRMDCACVCVVADMTTNNGWPGKPGVPINPERDGWHWVRRVDEKQAHIQRWIGSQFWLSPSFGGPKTDMANYEYLGPALTPDEAATLQKRVAELEAALNQAKQHFVADEPLKAFVEICAALEGGKDV